MRKNALPRRTGGGGLGNRGRGGPLKGALGCRGGCSQDATGRSERVAFDLLRGITLTGREGRSEWASNRGRGGGGGGGAIRLIVSNGLAFAFDVPRCSGILGSSGNIELLLTRGSGAVAAVTLIVFPVTTPVSSTGNRVSSS